MAFDEFTLWCQDLERRLDPAAQMAHFLGGPPDPWQVEAVTSRAQTMALRVCRQAGKSEVLSALGVQELQAGGTTIALCPAERQVRELVRKVAAHLRKTDLIVERATQSEIECNSGGRFIAVPASGATIRGYSATQILVDECAYIPNDEETIVALLPMLGDGPNCRIVYASTPAGKNNFFARLFLNARPGDGIHRIVVSGESIPRLATRVARLKQQLSPTRYRQEVCVEMLSDGLGYFDLDLIGRATSDVKALLL
ncbi:MAG: terminase large subunit domain-containing protein [Gemmobacter sp.]